MRQSISFEDALLRLPQGETVHTFINPGVGVLAGVDWDRADIIDALRNAGTIELTGEQAQKMNHGIAIQQSVNDWLFIETVPPEV